MQLSQSLHLSGMLRESRLVIPDTSAYCFDSTIPVRYTSSHQRIPIGKSSSTYVMIPVPHFDIRKLPLRDSLDNQCIPLVSQMYMVIPDTTAIEHS
jgi:hypothetical protein